MELDLERLFAQPGFPASGWNRMPTVAGQAMVATSHPLATRAGVHALEAGGNAVDAALCAAAVLTVAEPPMNGLGGDAFALVWKDGQLHGLNGSGRSPGRIDELVVEASGPRSVTVPGAVSAWAELAERHGTFGLDRCLAPAIEHAERGVVATPRIAALWQVAESIDRAPWPSPRVGERYTLPGLAGSLRRVAEQGPPGLYDGQVAEAIAAASWLSIDDLAAHRSEWVEPLRFPYRGLEVCELPPNGWGATALIALGIWEGLDVDSRIGRLHGQIESMKLAFADAQRYIHDGPLPAQLLDPVHLAARRAEIGLGAAGDFGPSQLRGSDTTYLCCVDSEGNAISLIQSLFHGFGSGVLAGDTGIVLQNRGSGFVLEEGHPNRLEPGKRPFHTIIPGMLLESGELLGPFGVMGGFMQAQGHMQVVAQVADLGADPQSALDAARFRYEGGRTVRLEAGLHRHADALRALGHDVIEAPNQHGFGVGQMILRTGGALVGGSDPRGDGACAGI
jgi:gamma-glutamyltranspeptidase/glutathione hydrolase